MIQIREPQEKALSEAAWERFVDELAEHLGRAFPAPSAALPRGALLELAAGAVAAARADGMTGDASITTWAECALVFGPSPWKEAFAAPLAQVELPPEVRHHRFVRLATPVLEPHRAAG